MVVERLQVDGSVDVDGAVVGNGVAQRCAVVELCTALPGVRRGVLGVGLEPVQEWNLLERRLVGCGEVLVVVERCSPVLQAGPYGVFPCLVGVGVQVFVDGGVGLLNLGSCGRGEAHVEVLGEVPSQL